MKIINSLSLTANSKPKTQEGFTLMSTALKGNLKGFTLIELMVAIAIVAVLATIGFSLFQNAQGAARDARRRGDIDAISKALETNFDAVAGTYVAPATTMFTGGVVPADPLNTGAYVYSGSPAAGATSFVICAKLERGGGNSSDIAGTPASNGAFYCTKNQQQ